MNQDTSSRLEADIFLLHAPSVYDFRERDDMLFAYLSDSNSVNVTSVYEMYPIGWFSIKQWLADHGLDAKIVNVASLMLHASRTDVRRLLGRLEAPIFGFDLHWMTQCHGAIELATALKEVHPEALTIFGGISATYYASQLISYPSVDVVIQGYDTLQPVTELVARVRRGSRDFRTIPNLLYKVGGEVQATGFTHKPATRYNNVRNDWSYYQETPVDGLSSSKLIMTLPNTGCAHDCGWCGGSKVRLSKYHGCPQDSGPEGQRPHHRRTAHDGRGGETNLDIRASVLFREQSADAPLSGRRERARIQ